MRLSLCVCVCLCKYPYVSSSLSEHGKVSPVIHPNEGKSLILPTEAMIKLIVTEEKKSIKNTV